MEKLDLKKQLASLYRPSSRDVAEVDHLESGRLGREAREGALQLKCEHVRRDGNRLMSTDYVVQPAGPEHLDQLSAIERAAATRFGDLLPRSVLSHVTPVGTLEAAQLAGMLWVALEPAGNPVGFAVASVHGRRAHLEELDVLPEYGRKGVGSALVEAVLDYALNGGCTEITLTTFSDVPWNAPFYANIGFEVILEQELDADLLKRLSDETELGLDRSRRVAMRKPLGR